MAEYKNNEKKEAPISIFLENLSLYAEGKSNGEWIRLPQEENELRKIYGKIAGVDGAETFITDFSVRDDCMYARKIIGEWSNVFELNTIASLIGDEPHPSIEAYMQENEPTLLEFANLFMQEEEIPFYSYEFEGSDNPEVMERLSKEEKMGYTMLESNLELKNMLEDIPLGNANVMSYLDVEAVGRDLSLSGDVTLTESGYFDERMGVPDLTSYSWKMIRDELAKQTEGLNQKQMGEDLASYKQEGHIGQAVQKADTTQKKETAKKQQHKPPVAPSL